MEGKPDFCEVLLSVESGVLGFGIRNTAKGIWNPTNDWTSESTFPEVHEFQWQRLESKVWNPVQDSLTWGQTTAVTETELLHYTL